MVEVFGSLIIVAICVLAEGFFSGSELAFVSADRLKLKMQAKKGSKRSALALKLIEEPEWILGTTLIGTNVCTITGASLVAYLVIRAWGEPAEYLAICFFLPVTLLLGEIVPKAIYQRKANTLLPIIIYPLHFFSKIFYPILYLSSRWTRFLTGLIGKEKEISPLVTREALDLMLKTSGKSDMKTAEKKMVDRIFDFAKIEVRQIMIPLVNVAAIEANRPFYDVMEMVKEERYSRYPIFQGRVYNIIGLVTSYDLLRFEENRELPIKELMRPVDFVPETMVISKLLPRMQRSGTHMSVVVDEYGGAIGIVTIEDILEEVVGKIEDEYDVSEVMIYKIGHKRYIVKANMPIDEFNEITEAPRIPKGDYETIAGYLLEKFKRIPRVGDRCFDLKTIYEVTKANRQTIQEVKVIFL